MVIFFEVKTKLLFGKIVSKSREVCLGMNCEYCGKPVKEFQLFILVGKYPTRGQMWKWSEASYYVAPESYGKIYHKDCFLEALNKEKAKSEVT